MATFIIKIDGVPDNYTALPFGRQIEHRHTIAAFQKSARCVHFGAKGKTTAKAFREFQALYEPKQWYAVNRDTSTYHDDSFPVWFKL